jgi:hypothetical protein
MTRLLRGAETVSLTTILWESLQVLAQQEGWRPAGRADVAEGAPRVFYGPGRAVTARDARAFADALERLVNGDKLDELTTDLAPLVQLVNFLRGGAFDIR